jgi:hypothetical protein
MGRTAISSEFAKAASSLRRVNRTKNETRIMSHLDLIEAVAPATPNAVPAVRIAEANPDHHLWNNNGTWWIHYTLHLPDYTKHRVRRSLGTRHSRTARARRDQILAELLSHPPSGLN